MPSRIHGVVVLAAPVDGGAKDYHIARTPPPAVAFLLVAFPYGKYTPVFSKLRTQCKRGFSGYVPFASNRHPIPS